MSDVSQSSNQGLFATGAPPAVSHHWEFAIMNHVLDRRFGASEVNCGFGDIE
jgi:hypothetical protein